MAGFAGGWKAAVVSACALALAACETASDLVSFEDPPAPSCPVSGILKDAERLVVFTPGSAEAITDVRWEGEILSVGAVCTLEDREAEEVSVYLEFLVDASLGPAATSEEQEFTYFIALLQGERVLKKSVNTAVIDFGDFARARSVQAIEDFTFTPAPDFGPGGYQVLVGFQLSETQMEANRARRAR